MDDPRTPNSERHVEPSHGEVERAGPPDRPEVIREEVIRPGDSRRERERLRDDVRPASPLPPERTDPTRERMAAPHDETHAHQMGVARVLSLWVAVIAGIVEVFLLFRLALLWAGANAQAGFVTFINRSTNWMVAPFQGVAPDFSAGGNVLDSATVMAIIIYFIAALVLITALRVLGTAPHTHRTYPGSPERHTRAF